MDTLFYLGIIFVFGSLTQLVSPMLNIPKVVGYLILGLIIGPEIFGIIPREFVENSHLITDLALSIIAVLVGATLKVSILKKHAKEVTYITILQSVGTFVIVSVGFILCGEVLNFESSQVIIIALLLGGIATATAPATPLAIIHELSAKGSFTSTFLAIIAIDDAISLLMFSLALTIGITLVGSSEFTWNNITEAVILIVLSSVVGIVAALINTAVEKFLSESKSMETISTIGLIFIMYSLSEYWHLEPLLSAMVMGVIVTNISPDFDLVQEEIDSHLVDIIFMLFFIISAMHLKISAVFALPVAIGLYVVLRFFGKVVGSYVGAVISGSSKVVKKYMGFALIPQAGIAIGLALSLQKYDGLEEIAQTVLNIVIATTFIHELIGPFMTRYSIKKSGDSEKK